jgi:hypothetical protein
MARRLIALPHNPRLLPRWRTRFGMGGQAEHTPALWAPDDEDDEPSTAGQPIGLLLLLTKAS